MPNGILHQKVSKNNPIRSKYHQGLKLMIEYYKAPTRALVNHLREQGYSFDDIANIPDFPFTSEAIRISYTNKEAQSE